MKVVCRNCGDLPIQLPDLPEEMPEVRSRYEYRFSTIMSCPECKTKGLLALEAGSSNAAFYHERWKNKKDIQEVQRVLQTEFLSIIRNKEGKGPIETVEFGHGQMSEDHMLDYASKGVVPVMVIDYPRRSRIPSLEDFMNQFFKSVKNTYNVFPHERGYIRHLMKASIFFLGEETDVYQNAESICTSAKLPFLLPFDNCLFFLRNEQSGLWVVSHLYKLETFLSEWSPPDGMASSVRHTIMSEAYEDAPDSVCYREWHFCNSHPESYRAQEDLKLDNPQFLTRELWHAMLSEISFNYEDGGMAAMAKSRAVPITSNNDSIELVRRTNGFVDTLFHVAAVSSPVNYIVKVTPKRTPKEDRQIKKGRTPDYRKRPHFIIVDHQTVTSMNPDNQGTHASPRPHMRRGHWRRASDYHKNLLARGVSLIPVRPAIIGKDRFEDGKNHYHILMSHAPETVGN
jgi:hypothetical protein